jgi:hypothetical protein
MSTLSDMHAKATAMLEMIGEDLDAFGGDVEGHLRVVIAHLEHVIGDAKPTPVEPVAEHELVAEVQWRDPAGRTVTADEPAAAPAAVKRTSGKS